MSEVSDPIFARIAARYDRVNRILSLGQEQKWRATGIAMLAQGTVLDLGCGTGATEFDNRGVVGLDPVIEMLALSQVRDRVVGVGETLPFRDASLDAVFSGFVFRNLSSIDQTLDEIDRVLKPGSTAVVVDLARPRNGVAPDAPQTRHRRSCCPLVGLLFAGAPREYWYLHRSLDSLPPPETLYLGHALTPEHIWRMGMFGFVYGARLRKPDLEPKTQNP